MNRQYNENTLIRKVGADILSNRANALCVLKILQEYSDEKHILPMREIIEHLQKNYDIKMDRRTVYSTVELLQYLGYDVSDYEENGQGYYDREDYSGAWMTRTLCDHPADETTTNVVYISGGDGQIFQASLLLSFLISLSFAISFSSSDIFSYISAGLFPAIFSS